MDLLEAFLKQKKLPCPALEVFLTRKTEEDMQPSVTKYAHKANDRRSEVGRLKSVLVGEIQRKNKNPATSTTCTKTHEHFSHTFKSPTDHSQFWSLN